MVVKVCFEVLSQTVLWFFLLVLGQHASNAAGPANLTAQEIDLGHAQTVANLQPHPPANQNRINIFQIQPQQQQQPILPQIPQIQIQPQHQHVQQQQQSGTSSQN